MSTVDLVYDQGCPNVKTARANLMRAFSRAGVPVRWTEHQIGSSDAPAHVRGYGSPTILVDGVDVEGLVAGAEDCCRVYAEGGAPGVEIIAAALTRARSEFASPSTAESKVPDRAGWKSTAAVLPGIGIALMPKVVCPLCWPAYAGILSAAGLTFLMEDRWLLPISAVFLAAALAALAWKVGARRGYGPLGLGAISSSVILVGKFALDSTSIMYTGIGFLVAACVWNAWPRRRMEQACPACPSPETN